MSDIAKDAGRKYLIQLQTHPLRTKAITAGVLVGCSDAIAQKISGFKKLQLRRLLLMVLYGCAYSGPLGHFLHKLMDILFRGKKGNRTVAMKVLLEQLTTSPLNNLMFMMYHGLVVDGRPWVSVKGKVRVIYPSVQLTAWKFWPIVGWMNYQYVPVQLRVLFAGFAGACWAVFLNLKARSAAAPDTTLALKAPGDVDPVNLQDAQQLLEAPPPNSSPSSQGKHSVLVRLPKM